MGKIERVGVFITDRTSGKVLIVKGNEAHKWSIPKGAMNVGESFRQTAMRELYEETSLVIDLCDIYRTTKIRNVLYYHVVLDNDAQELNLTTNDPGEICQIGWFSIDHIKTLNCNYGLSKMINFNIIKYNIIKKQMPIKNQIQIQIEIMRKTQLEKLNKTIAEKKLELSKEKRGIKQKNNRINQKIVKQLKNNM